MFKIQKGAFLLCAALTFTVISGDDQCKDFPKHINLTIYKQPTRSLWASCKGYIVSLYAPHVDLCTVSPERLQWLIEQDDRCAEIFADQLIDKQIVLKVPVENLKVLMTHESFVQRVCRRCMEVLVFIVSLIVL